MRTVQLLALYTRFLLLTYLAGRAAGASFCTRNSETKCILSQSFPISGHDVDSAAPLAAAAAAAATSAGQDVTSQSTHTIVGVPDNGQCIRDGGRLATPPLPLTITTPVGDTVPALQSALGPVVLSGDPFRSALFLAGWSTWSCALPAGAPLIINVGPLATATFAMPPWVTGFTIETEPNTFPLSTITATARDSLGNQAVLAQDVVGNGGAKAYTFVATGAFLAQVTFTFPAGAGGGAFARGFIQAPLPMEVNYVKVRSAAANNGGKGRWAFQSTIPQASALPLDVGPVIVALYGPGGILVDSVLFPAATCKSNSARTVVKCAQPNVGRLNLAATNGGSAVAVKASLKNRVFANPAGSGPLVPVVSSPALGTRTATASACKRGGAASLTCKRT